MMRISFRLEVDPSKHNGLREVSQIAIDKITVVPAAKIGDVIGEASDALLLRVNRALALFLGSVNDGGGFYRLFGRKGRSQ